LAHVLVSKDCVPPQRFDQRLKQFARAADPIGQCRTVQFHALSLA